MITVNTHEAKTRLSELLALVEQKHEEVTICRNGKAVAKLVATESEPIDRLKPIPELGPIVFHEDPTAPLDEDAWPEEFR
jgi:prevent-host-death family protein